MLGAVCASAALLLLWSGLAKLRRPDPAVQMLRALLGRDVPARRVLVRLIGVVELTVGTSVLVNGGRIALGSLAACYLVFAAVAARLTTGVRRAPCGCFGRSETPVGALHVVVDSVAAAVAVAGAVHPFGPLAGYADQEAAVLVVGLGQVVVLAAMTYLLITALPDVLAARDQVVKGL